MEKKGFVNDAYFFDLIDSKLKKARLYGSKRKININSILFSYCEFIIWRNIQIFPVRCVMLVDLLNKIIIQIKK